MNRLIRLVREAHRRSLWQVLAVYVFTSWAVLGIVDTLTGVWGLPDWVPPFAFVLLLIGLPIVLATAVVQEGAFGRRAEQPAGATPGGSDAPPVGEETSGAGSGAPPASAPMFLQRLGPLYEELGDTERALHYHRRLVELWADADPELQPQVEHARERIAALEGDVGR